ncbi:hypothetical protein Q5P01_018558 [Channa striata]|uniref:O(6)-methylguanine-induced apoptosis 2 n=1 Tax=Channa striata TaxID=64152 RepID=A0AA88M619_CHASR|nr:hypothetical protein Q5P01_018558 [Channa striata]
MGNMYRGLKKNKTQDYNSSASIPTKYQRVVITNPEKRGFSSQAKRFPSISPNENPGPASYGCISSAELNSPSFSKKGTTGFVASKPAKFYSNPQRNVPGPNVYNIKSSFENKHDFNVGASRVFRLPVAVQPDGPKDKTPAPNQYNLNYESKERHSTVVGTSAFLSKTGRSSICASKNVPSPCHYKVNDHFTQHSSNPVLSPFKSTTQRIPALVDNHVPGPGAYSPYQTPTPVKKTKLPRGYYLALAAPPLMVPKDPPLPGPGQYNINGHYTPFKHPMPTAAFASRTERTLQNAQPEMSPGPGFYDPRLSSKQSFFYCDSRVWIPV